jgi:hypothetical protein
MKHIILGAIIGIIVGVVGSKLFMMPNMSTMDHSRMNMPEEMDMSGMHKMIKVDPEAPIPEVSITVTKDMMDGYNLKVDTENYTFTPEAINDEVVSNAGHAHIYVNGIKAARLYSDSFHLGSNLFTQEENEIRVTLNANNHDEWSTEGVTIADSVTVEKPK